MPVDAVTIRAKLYANRDTFSDVFSCHLNFLTLHVKSFTRCLIPLFSSTAFFTLSRIANSPLSGCRRSVFWAGRGCCHTWKQTDGTTAWPTSSSGPLGTERRMTRGKKESSFLMRFNSLGLLYSPYFAFFPPPVIHVTSMRGPRCFWRHRSKRG